MADMNQRISIIFDVIDEATAKIKSISNAASTVSDRMNKAVGRTEAFDKKVQKNTASIWKSQKASKAFRFEFLGIMFAGMALQKTFSNMLQPAFELTGIFDVWGLILQDLFLPVALPLLDVFLWLYDIFSGLPEPVKTVIGVFALLMVGLGMILSFVGQIGLFLTTIGGAFAGVSTIAGGFGVIMSWVGGILAFLTTGVIGPIILAIAALAAIWIFNIGNIQKHAADFLSAFIGFVGSIIGLLGKIIEFVVNIFTGKWGDAWRNLGEMVDIFWNGILGNFAKASAALVGFLIDLGKDFIRFGAGIVGWIVDGIKGMGSAIWDAIVSAVPEPFRGMLKGVGNFIGGIGSGIGNVISGIGNVLGFAEGGYTGSYQGLAYLHPNEFIIPASKAGDMFNSSITVNASVSSDYDVKRLAQQIQDEMSNSYRSRSFA